MSYKYSKSIQKVIIDIRKCIVISDTNFELLSKNNTIKTK